MITLYKLFNEYARHFYENKVALPDVGMHRCCKVFNVDYVERSATTVRESFCENRKFKTLASPGHEDNDAVGSKRIHNGLGNAARIVRGLGAEEEGLEEFRGAPLGVLSGTMLLVHVPALCGQLGVGHQGVVRSQAEGSQQTAVNLGSKREEKGEEKREEDKQRGEKE